MAERPLTGTESHWLLLVGEIWGKLLTREAVVSLEKAVVVFHSQWKVPEFPRVAEQVWPHPHLRELLHPPLFAALVLEPDLNEKKIQTIDYFVRK